MYNLHHTKGVILSGTDFGESDRLYNIYTKDFGKVFALAKGARLEKSKLRPHLSLFSLAKISFIEGKEFLRLTDATETSKPDFNGKKFFLFGRICSFIERMIKGQEKDEKVWHLIESAFLFLHGSEPSEVFEPLFSARLLHRLGYIDNDSEIVLKNGWNPLENTNQINELKKINESGLFASQL